MVIVKLRKVNVSFLAKDGMEGVEAIKTMIANLPFPSGCKCSEYGQWLSVLDETTKERAGGYGFVLTFSDHTEGHINLKPVAVNTTPALVVSGAKQLWIEVRLPRDKASLMAKALVPFAEAVTGKTCPLDGDVFQERYVDETMDYFFAINLVLAEYRRRFPPIQWWQSFDEYLKWVLDYNMSSNTVEMIQNIYAALIDDHAAPYAVADRLYFHKHTVRGLSPGALEVLQRKFNNLDESYRKELLSPIDTVSRARIRLKRLIGQRKV